MAKKKTTSGTVPGGKVYKAASAIVPDEVDPNNLTEQLETIFNTGTQGMRRQVISSIDLAYTKGELPQGTRQRNFPSQKMQKIEQDDEKRAFLAKVIQNNLVFFKMGINSRANSDEEICERLNFYFAECARTQQLTTVEKLGLCLGFSVQEMREIELGNHPGFSPATKIIIQKAKNMIAAIDAEMAAEGRIQPVVYLFRAKNFYGMKDTQDVVVTPNNPLGDFQDATTIAAKYDELPE